MDPNTHPYTKEPYFKSNTSPIEIKNIKKLKLLISSSKLNDSNKYATSDTNFSHNR